MNKVLAIVGMTGAGKTEAASVFKSQGWQFVRFGQITLDEVMRQGLEVNEKNEKKVREEMRATHGMAAYAILNQPVIDTSLKKGNVVIDGLYSWAEYKVLKNKYGDTLVVCAVHTSPKARYARLESRAERHGEDKEKKFRSFTPAESRSRDYSEIENLEKGGPIAMADYTVVNEGSLEELQRTVRQIIQSLDS